jgi:hypothetical protein
MINGMDLCALDELYRGELTMKATLQFFSSTHSNPIPLKDWAIQHYFIKTKSS